MKVKNVSPLGDLDVATPNGYVLVKAGETFDTSDAHGKSLCDQPSNWVPAKEDKETDK